MKIEFLHFEGCPGVEKTRARLQQVLDLLAPRTNVDETSVRSEDEARRLGFLGSPSIRIDGLDLEGRVGPGGGLSCRLYGSEGAPPVWMIEAAVLRALEPNHILFLCVANSARSQMAEGIARSLAPDHVVVSSAGSAPLSVRPEAVQSLAEIDLDISSHSSKSIDDVDRESVNAVITLCAEEVCPFFPGKVSRLHWGLADPAAVNDDERARMDAFREVRDELSRRLRILFLASPASH